MDYKEKIAALARLDPWYLKCLQDVKEKEPAFLAIRERLTEEEKYQLDAYIAACEELEYALIPIAHRLGKEG